MTQFIRKWRQKGYGILAVFLSAAPLVMAPEDAVAAAFENPLRFNTIEEFIEGALQAFVYIALPVVAFFIVFSGFKFLAAQGNQEELAKAKRNFMYVVVGASLALGAWALATLIKGTIDQLRG